MEKTAPARSGHAVTAFEVDGRQIITVTVTLKQNHPVFSTPPRIAPVELRQLGYEFVRVEVEYFGDDHSTGLFDIIICEYDIPGLMIIHVGTVRGKMNAIDTAERYYDEMHDYCKSNKIVKLESPYGKSLWMNSLTDEMLSNNPDFQIAKREDVGTN